MRRFMMFLTLFVFGCAAFRVHSCSEEEFAARDGLCCPMCQPGTVVGKECTALSGTQCTPCESGTFMNQRSGLKKCFACTSCEQSHGLFAQQACTPTSDTVCDVLSGFYCKSLADDTGCSLAERHAVCVPGQRIKEAGTSRNDTVCELCQPGSFSADGVKCTAWTTCTENEVEVKEGSVSSDVVCGVASRQHYFTYVSVVLLLTTLISGLVIRGKLTK